ncbi:MAG TPA: xanthine dehydrogenase family protein molybdopterin-binding subunit [Stellaceae bacterium]|nr:xanthine dehydrogenase family protein molybdopterin-binding subunit [Stellaceae bacterium]
MDSVPDGGVGAPVRRTEDERFLTGQGHYADDVAIPGTVFAVVARSPHAHARIGRVDKTDALASPGVLAVLTGEDVAREKIGGLPCQQFPRALPGVPFYLPTQPILASGKVRYVGDRVALVVAETLAQAKDAAERIAVAYEALQAVTLPDALAPNAPKIWDEAQSNLSFQIEMGDRAAVDAQFAAAAHVTKLSLHYPRATANSMEPRSAIAYRDPVDGRFTLISSTQNPWRVREILCEALAIPPTSLRVRAMDVGGGFGMKNHVYPEEALVLWAAGKLRRPVKWTADRSEGISSDQHARHQITEAALALDRNGRLLALRTNVAIDVGAYLGGNAGIPPTNTGASYPGVYNLTHVHTVVRAAFTNTSHLGPYRASGKPEASFILERLMDKAAREMGIDPIDLRRRNLIRAADLPFRTPAGNIYDCGDFERVLDQAMALADLTGFAARRAGSERKGLRRGVGMAMYCAYAGRFSERMEIRVAENGSVAIYAGTLATGQGHETMFAQMVSDWLGVPFGDIRLFQGDTDKVLFGRGTFAQRSTSIGGSALKAASDEVVRKARRLSAWMMEVAEADVVVEPGLFRVSGTDRQVTWREVTRKSYIMQGLPPELGVGLDGVGTYPGHFTFPNGCMIAEVEVDTETGTITVDRLCAVDDAGVVINPLTIEGQVHGSIAQGLGETLMEEMVYDRKTGQLLSGSFMDYAMPRADIMPDIKSEFAPVPTKSNLTGTKGGSEPGNVGAPGAIVNAVIDALAPLGVTDMQIPAKPERVWQALREAAKARA